jgi:hypothetical protein
VMRNQEKRKDKKERGKGRERKVGHVSCVCGSTRR